jgi:hypothetical protein
MTAKPHRNGWPCGHEFRHLDLQGITKVSIGDGVSIIMTCVSLSSFVDVHVASCSFASSESSVDSGCQAPGCQTPHVRFAPVRHDEPCAEASHVLNNGHGWRWIGMDGHEIFIPISISISIPPSSIHPSIYLYVWLCMYECINVCILHMNNEGTLNDLNDLNVTRKCVLM